MQLCKGTIRVYYVYRAVVQNVFSSALYEYEVYIFHVWVLPAIVIDFYFCGTVFILLRGNLNIILLKINNIKFYPFREIMIHQA